MSTLNAMDFQPIKQEALLQSTYCAYDTISTISSSSREKGSFLVHPVARMQSISTA
jgi:hypothetical protein